jgi:hypothetical protein
LSGPSSGEITGVNGESTSITGLVPGVYILQLTVTDNLGAASVDQVTITVTEENRLPIAKAGPDQQVALYTNVTLNGSASIDLDGKIEKYNWTRVAGPGALTITNGNTAYASFIAPAIGEYTIELTVTDNSGASSKDQVKVIVSGTLPPSVVAHAGKDTSITFPDNKGVLNGSASIGTTGAQFSWRQLSGPSTAHILQRNALVTKLNQLTLGTYVFELTITNSHNVTDKDTLQISVVSFLRITSYYNIYPNPFRDQLTIECLNDTTGTISVVIYDVHGRKMINRKLEKTAHFFKESVDISQLPAALYILELLIVGELRPVTMQLIKKE